MLKDISVKLNGKFIIDRNLLYSYRAYLETLLNYSMEVQSTRLLCEVLIRDTNAKDMDPAVDRNSEFAKRSHGCRVAPLFSSFGAPI